MADKESKTAEYTYTKLIDLQANSTVNVFGVVKFARPPTKTRGSDYSMVLSIIDPSLHGNDQKLKCLLFNKEKESLPFLDIGKIVRLHRLKITRFHGELQGQSGPGFSWLAFDADKESPIRPVSSSTANYTFTESNKKRVEELRDWVATLDDIQQPNKTCFSDMKPQQYYDIYCQVLATCILEENVGILLRVWDGTKPTNPVREFDISAGEFTADKRQDLLDIAGHLALDVALYDDHYETGRKIKPGQFIKLNNLHAATYVSADTRPEMSELPMIELVIHRGTTYGRGVHVIKDDFDGIKTLKERLEKVTDEFRRRGKPGTSGHSNSAARKDTEVVDNSRNCRSPAGNHDMSTSQPSINLSSDNHSQERGQTQEVTMEVSCDRIDQSQPGDQTHLSNSQQSQNMARCMMQTSTVVVNHPHVQCTKIKDVLSHSVPYKFRILAKVVDFFPRFNRPADICKLYCPECNYLCEVPVDENGENSLKISRRGRQLKHYLCPVCSKDSQFELEYIFMMRFWLRDKTGEMVVNIWRKDAVTFFQDITPVEMLTEPALCNVIENCLNVISDPDKSDCPWFECCVKSYNTQMGVRYQIFDTCLV